MNKLEVARRQLGVALWLFLDDLDPVTVHVLACGAGEILDSLATRAGTEPLSQHILKTNPDMDMRELRILRNVYWNAFKHATTQGGGFREDQETLDRFSDEKNDVPLLLAWSDYWAITGKLPVEAQVFQTWFYALYESKLAKAVDVSAFRTAFPMVSAKRREVQKAMLSKKAAECHDNPALRAHPETEPSLLL